MNGFDVLERLTSDIDRTLPHVIFVTANDRYAVRAFEIHATDYLLKPFTPERLQTAVQRVREQLWQTANRTEMDASKKPEEEQYTTRMVFKSRGRILFLSVDDIRWIEAQENYVRICTGKDSHCCERRSEAWRAGLIPIHFYACIGLQL